MSSKPQPPLPSDEAYNAGNPEHVKGRQKMVDLRDLTRRAGLKAVMISREGRAWMYGVLEACGVFRSSFTGNSETFMREGQRNIGLIIIADIMRDHDELYTLMCREAREMGARGFSPFVPKKPKEEEAEA